MENIKISKVCGLCAGCDYAIEEAKKQLQSHEKVTLFKEIVHNKNVNKMLENLGIAFEEKLENLKSDTFVILRAHGEPKSTYEYLKKNNINFKDCTCAKVKKIHSEIEKFDEAGYQILIIGKYGKKNEVMHPEIVGSAGWSKNPPILVEDFDDLEKLENLSGKKIYLVCQTTFSEKKADELIFETQKICENKNIELVINKSICDAQKMINKFSAELAKNSDVMIVVGGKNSSNTKELFENVKKITKSIFLENIEEYKIEFEKNNIPLSPSLKIGITAGASTMKSELAALKKMIEKEIIKENNPMNISVNCHSSIKIDDMFFDPYNLDKNQKPAKYIFLTHTHYDHLSPDDLKKITNESTTFIAPTDAKETLEKLFPKNKKIYVSPNETFDLDGMKIETIPAFNLAKNFHKKGFGWVGYKLTKNNVSYAVLGDTDALPEHENLAVDVLFVPIGGTFTMNAEEAATLTNKIKPSLVVPVHYNLIVGSKKDEEIFLKNLSPEIEYKIFV